VSSRLDVWIWLQEIDSIDAGKDVPVEDADGIDGIPIQTDSQPASVVTASVVTVAADSGQKVSATKVSAGNSSQPTNDVVSDDEEEWKSVAPQGASKVAVTNIVVQ